jgi:phosphoglucomutase
MAEKIKEYEKTGEHQVIFSYEESYGYMMGSYVRDKDAVTASMMIAEMAAYYFDRGMTLYDAMQELYAKYGFYSEKTLNLMMPGIDGLAKMAELMAGLRKEPPKVIGGTAVKALRDYSDGTYYDMITGGKTKLPMSGSNVLYFELSDGTSFIVRPSGTEPKVKIYILASGETPEICAGRIENYAAYAETLRG